MARVVSQSVLEAHLRDDPEIRRCVFRVAEAVAAEAKEIAPKGEGPGRYKHGAPAASGGVMAASIFAEPTTFGARARSPVDWAAPNEGGTGMYGPKHAPIRSKAGKNMVFFATAKKGKRAGQQQLFILTSHEGMPASRPMGLAAARVAASSPGLTYRPHPWRVAHI